MKLLLHYGSDWKHILPYACSNHSQTQPREWVVATLLWLVHWIEGGKRQRHIRGYFSSSVIPFNPIDWWSTFCFLRCINICTLAVASSLSVWQACRFFLPAARSAFDFPLRCKQKALCRPPFLNVMITSWKRAIMLCDDTAIWHFNTGILAYYISGIKRMRKQLQI